MTVARYSSVKRMDLETAGDTRMVDAMVRDMTANITAKMLLDGYEPLSGTVSVRTEVEKIEGEPYDRAWWEVLLKLPVRRRPDTELIVLRVAADAIPAPRDGSFL